jgi:hypothetical protein
MNQSAAGPPTPIELDVLEACHEVTLRQKELLPLLAKALQVPESEVFYTWAFRRCEQHGALAGTDWAYFFHGLECDLKNTADGRFLRIDFGPGGRVDTFTMWGVLQFIMTSVPPWREFARLKPFLAEAEPPFDEFSGDFAKMSSVWDHLVSRGAFEPADAGLVGWAAKHTSQGPDGITAVQPPPGTTQKTVIDCMVARRTRLSPEATRMLRTHAAEHTG